MGRCAGSPARRLRPETLLRLLLVLAGLPEPDTGLIVADANGGWIATPDLSYRQVKIAIEYDGQHHFTVRQRVRDVSRNDLLVDDGWKVIVVLDHHLFQQPERTILRALDALYERGHPGAPRWPTSGWRAHFE